VVAALEAATAFDAVVLAVSPHARARIAGVPLVERGRRVAVKAGARRVLVIERAEDARELAAWAAGRGGRALLVIAAGEQLVHTPLVSPLVAADATGARRVAVDPDGAHAGALLAAGDADVDDVIAAIAAAPATADRDLAARWTDAARIPHGAIARHPATTPAERRAARELLFGLIVKGEDGPVTRWFYRPVSRVLTRALVHTPITPNQVSIVVAILGAIGCWLTARGDYTGLWLGALLVLVAGWIDGCDGEIARIKLQFSPIGAWLDTVVDEATTTAYLIAIGLHTHARLPDHDWVVPSIWIGVVAYVVGIYCIYFFLVVVSKTGNSQHYVSRLEIVDDADGPALRRPPPTASKLPLSLRKLGVAFSHVIRRDFINLGAVVFALADFYLGIYVTMWVGGIVMLIVVGPDHLRLRRQLAELRRRGAAPRLLPS
jgi:phosphatidylglycerophosphate synthase